MATADKPAKEILAEFEELRLRLEEAEETLRAIGSGEVDAFVVSGPEGPQIFTLKGAEQPYRVLVESMNEGAAILAADGTILYCNKRLATMLQVPLGWLIGTRLDSHVATSDQLLFSTLLGQCADGVSNEVTMMSGAGNTVPVLISCCSLDLSVNKEIGVVITDLTQRKQMEEEYERLAAIVESSADAILSKDLDGIILSWNAGAERMFGYRAHEVIGRPITVLLPPDRQEEEDRVLQRLYRGERIEHLETVRLAKDGRRIDVSITCSPLKDRQGRLVGSSKIIRDISEHRKLEDQLRQAQKMESIGTLAGGIAHDFNNILTAIIGFCNLALMQMGPDDPQRENIEHVLEGGDRAAQLTRDLLIFSRKEVSEKRPVDLNEIIGKVEKFLVRVIGEEIKCKMALHNEPIVIHADPHQLEQVLMNLATNARDAMAKGGNLTISSEQITLGDDFVAMHGYGEPGRYALLTISDTGEGMDEETRQKIFDPFFTTKEVGKGTGLGLAVVYGIIKQHEGFINVYSEPGCGATFKIYLPVISSESPGEETAHVKEILARGTETVLLAEDDDSVRGLVGIVLRQEGYTVIEAVDGKDAVKKFMGNRETVKLLISDLIMPNMDGKEAYDEMKVWQPELKAIFMSGYAPDIIRQKMSLGSAVVLISKPITPYALLSKVRGLLDGKEKQCPVGLDGKPLD